MRNKLRTAVALALLGGGSLIASAALAASASPAIAMGTNAAGLSNAAITLSDIKIERAAPVGTSSTEAPLAIAPYCSRGFTSSVEPITLVSIDGINNPSSATVGGTPAHEDFTTIIGAMAPGASYPITIKGNTDGNFSSGIAVYIDWDQSETFETTEGYFLGTLVGSTGVDAKSVSGTIAVPPGAALGQTRMRVVKQYGTTDLAGTPACGNSSFGQAEDYTIDVDVNAPVPPSLDMAFAPTNGPVGDSSTLTLTLGNTAAVANALTADLTNTFPAGLEVAAVPAASTTCTGGTLTTGIDSITLATGASIPPGGCTVNVDVTATTPGIFVNTVVAGDLETTMGDGPAASANYQATQDGFINYSVGFEAPDYNLGNLNGQEGWYGSVANDWKVSSANPGAGAQAVRGTWTTAGSGASFILSPTQPAGTTDYSVVSAKLAITTAGSGATWDFAPQDSEAGLVITRVRFLKGAGNKIQVLSDVGGGTLAYVDTGATWTAGSYFDLKFIAKRSDNSYKLCLNGTEIYNGVGFSSSIDNLAIIGNKGTGTQNNILDVDDVVINNLNWGGCSDVIPPLFTVTPSVAVGDGAIAPDSPQSVYEGDTTEFTLIPDPGFIVDNVAGTCGGTLLGNVYTTDAITADCTVIANFIAGAPPTWTVTPSVGTGAGTITPDDPQTITDFDTATFTLTPDAGFAIDNVGGSCGGTLTGNTFVTDAVTADCTVIANFAALPFPHPYCNVAFPSAVEPISRVLFTGFDNTSSATVGGSPALEDFLAVTGGAVMQGDTHTITVEGNTSGNFTAKIMVFVDWNQDGVFDAAEGYALSDLVNSTGADGKQSTGQIVVPTTALPGDTRMRVIKKFNTAATPCNTSGYGQAEDYTLTVTALPTYIVTPSVGAGDGSISPNTPQTVSQGATQSFTLTPDPGFVIDNVGGTCGGDLVGDVFTTDAVTEDCSVIANFRGLQVLVSKAFDPPQIAVTTEQSTLTITLTNETANVATLTAPLVDTLPADLDIVPGSGSTTCGLVIGGQVVSPAASTITLPAGIPIPAEGSCQVTVQVRSDVPGTYVNTIAVGDLQTDQGSNQTEATASLRVTGFPEIEVDPLSLTTALALNGSSTETLTIRNIGDDDLLWNMFEAQARPNRGTDGPAERMSPRAVRVPGSFIRNWAAAPMADVIQDGGFELGDPNPYWDSFSSNFGSVLCDMNCSQSPANAPRTGDWWVWMGGINSAETGYVRQDVTIAAGTASLSFWVQVPSASGLVGDFMTASIDGIELWRLTADAASAYETAYVQVTLDVSTFADGASHTVSFDAVVIGGGAGVTNFMLDDVSLDEGTGGGGGTCDNPTDIPWLSASPTSGTVVPLDEEDVSVTFDAAGMAPGTYNANICVASNDGHGNEMVVVPVTMEVAPSGQMFEVTSTVNGGNGSISPASVTVDENTTATFTLTPDFGFQPGPVTSSCGGALTGNTFVTGPVTGACTVEATFVPLPFPAPYCNVTFPSAVEPISRVVLAGLDNASSPTSGPALEDFRAVTPGAVVSLGGVYPIEVEGNTGGNYTNRIRVFIDWNRDGVFGPGESYVLSDLVNSTGTDGKKSTGEITVPGDALLGETRMRVIKRFSTVPDPCNTAGFGQAEDYTITVNNLPLPEPEIDLDSAAFDGTGALVIPSAQVGSSGNTTLDILNIGEPGSRLNYLIRRALAARPTGTRAGFGDRMQTINNDAAKAAAAGEPRNEAQTDLFMSAALSGAPLPTIRNVVLANDPLCAVGTTGLVVHDGNGVPDNGYGWNASAGTDPKIVDKFTPSTYPATYRTVCVSLVTNAGLTTAPVKVVVFADDGPGGAPGTELGRVSATANNIGSGLAQSFQAFDISSMALDIQSGSVYIGLEWDAAAISGLYIAADQTSATDAGGYAYTDTNGWAPIVDLHEEYKAMFIRAVEAAAGPPGVGCENPSNVPWLSVSPASGTIMDGETDTVTITGNATGMAPGSYEALLCIESNDPTQNRIDLTVKFEVTPLPPAIFSDGFEGDDPPVDPDIVTGTVNLPIPQDEDGGAFDFLTGTFLPYSASRDDHINLYDFGDGLYVYWYGDVWTQNVGGVTDSGGTEFAVLQVGDTIGPASNVRAASIKMVNWVGGTDGYIGIAFENSDTGVLNYGYIHLTTTGPSGFPAQVLEYGYNKSGAAITIPNP